MTQTALIALSLIWAGLVLGVSFIATPVKFKAPSLARPVAFDIGRVTFALFEKIEWLLAILFILLLLATGPAAVPVAYALIILVIVVMQVLWLTPKLMVRAEAAAAGKDLPRSLHHRVFIAIEVLKLASLVLFGLHMAAEL